MRNNVIKLTEGQLRRIIKQEATKRSPKLNERLHVKPTIDDAVDAQEAEQLLRSFQRFFEDDEVMSKNYELMTRRLREIQTYQGMIR